MIGLVLACDNPATDRGLVKGSIWVVGEGLRSSAQQPTYGRLQSVIRVELPFRGNGKFVFPEKREKCKQIAHRAAENRRRSEKNRIRRDGATSRFHIPHIRPSSRGAEGSEKATDKREATVCTTEKSEFARSRLEIKVRFIRIFVVLGEPGIIVEFCTSATGGGSPKPATSLGGKTLY